MFCLGGFCPGGFWQGGFLSGGLCPGAFVMGVFVLEPATKQVHWLEFVTMSTVKLQGLFVSHVKG